jgi:hypothetical protein
MNSDLPSLRQRLSVVEVAERDKRLISLQELRENVDDESENTDLELEIEDRGHLGMRDQRQGPTRKKPLKRESVLHKF